MKRMPIWLLTSLFSVVFAFGQWVPGRYIVELEGEPAIVAAAASRRAGRSQAMARHRSAIREEQHRMRGRLSGRARVINSVENVANALVVEAPDMTEEELASLPGVKRVHQVRLYHLAMDHAVNVVHAADAWAQVGGQQVAGAGTRIAIIDTGIDVKHPAFNDADFRAPDGFPQITNERDRINTNNKVIVARNYTASGTAAPTIGHGTSVAMVAAGVPTAAPLGVVSGIAPKAYLGNYKVFPDSGAGASDDSILKAMDDAVADGMDVINMSLGSEIAERPEFDPLISVIDRVAGAGVVVVVAAGNDGPDPTTVGSPAGALSAITVGNGNNERAFAASTGIDGLGTFVAVVPSEFSTKAPVTGTLADVAALDQNGRACDALPSGSLQGKIAFILRGVCTFATKLNNAQGAGATAAIVYTHAESPDAEPMDIGSATLPSEMISYADGLTIKKQLASGSSVTGTVTFSASAVAVSPWKMSRSSSRGPSIGSIKPDVVAVGTAVYSAALTRGGAAQYNTVSGTSFSSPMTAGAVALVKAARPGLSAQQYRSLIVNSASTFMLDGSTTALGLQQVGAGELNVAAALQSAVTSDPVSISFGIGGAKIDTYQNLALTNITKNTDTFTLEVVPLTGSVAPVPVATRFDLTPGSTQWIPLVFQASGLAAGEYQGVVRVRSARTGTEIRVPYWYGIASNQPKRVTILNQPDPGTTQSTARTFFLLFRMTDDSGIPSTLDPKVTISGNGSVDDVYSIDEDIADAYVAELTLVRGDNTVRIEAGDASQEIVITGR